MFEVRNNWMSELIAKKTDQELYSLFTEINAYRESGILVGNLLRALDEEITRNITHTRIGEMLRQVEDAVIFEMARRYANNIEENNKKSSLTDGKIVYYADAEGIEAGKICNILWKDGSIQSFGVDFGNDFDEFYGSAIGSSIFLTREDAELSMKNGDK